MKWLGLFVLAGCAVQPSRAPAQEPRPIQVQPPGTLANAPAPKIDEASLVARSHAWFDAWDRNEADTWAAPLGPTFILFEDARFIERDSMMKRLQTMVERHSAIRSRTWSDEHTYISGPTAVFIGRALENIPAEGDQPATTQDGFNTVIWVHDGTRWQIAHWQWQRAGLDAERERWNDAFRQGRSFSLKPNQLLVDTVKGKKPGTALDVGMGQGRNAVFLATQGWKTTGVDISDGGIKIAKDEAARLKVANKLETVQEDIDKYDFGKAKWDLVTLIYSAEDPPIVEKIKPSLKKDGLFVCEYFHADSEVAKSGAGGWKTGELAALFKDGGFKILRDEVVEDNADWAGQRKTKLVRFVAQKL